MPESITASDDSEPAGKQLRKAIQQLNKTKKSVNKIKNRNKSDYDMNVGITYKNCVSYVLLSDELYSMCK